MVNHDAPNPPSLRILVADDNRDSADSLCLLLQVWGHEALACYDGESVLEQVSRFKPHVLLQDILMPGMNGLEVARHLREVAATRDLVMVAVSGLGEPHDRQDARDAGFAYHLVKPVDFDRIEQILSSVSARIRLGAAHPQRNPP